MAGARLELVRLLRRCADPDAQTPPGRPTAGCGDLSTRGPASPGRVYNALWRRRHSSAHPGFSRGYAPAHAARGAPVTRPPFPHRLHSPGSNLCPAPQSLSARWQMGMVVGQRLEGRGRRRGQQRATRLLFVALALALSKGGITRLRPVFARPLAIGFSIWGALEVP